MIMTTHAYDKAQTAYDITSNALHAAFPMYHRARMAHKAGLLTDEQWCEQCDAYDEIRHLYEEARTHLIDVIESEYFTENPRPRPYDDVLL
jgi:hypothetical protein